MVYKIGFANKFFTLWSFESEKKYFTDGYGKAWLVGEIKKYSYIKNIAKSLDKVEELYPGVEIVDELKGARIGNYFEREIKHEPVEIIWFGKYYGKRIEDVAKNDFNYLVWMHSNCSTHIQEYIETLPEYKEHKSAEDLEQERFFSQHPIIKPGDVVKVKFERNAKIWDEENNIALGLGTFTAPDKEKPLNIWIEFKCKKIGAGKYSFYVVLIDGVEHKLKNKEIEFKAKDVSERWLDGYGKLFQKIII